MFLPFLIALLSVFGITAGKKKLGYGAWLLFLIITIAWFDFHATNPLRLSF
jgi:hypothetical protein